MDRQVIEIINELVEATAKTRRGSLWLHVDEESTEMPAPSTMQTHEPKTNIVP
jgi:hypothetical protein